jgi:hypothetical protein
MSEKKEYHGSMKMTDGRRVPLSADEAKGMWEAIERSAADRAERIPTSLVALKILSEAKDRMRELGWRDGRYCPRDGRQFAVCEIGSTGMWHGFWTSSQTDEGLICYADCVSSPREMFFKPLDKLTDEENALAAKCDADVAAQIASMFGGASLPPHKERT